MFRQVVTNWILYIYPNTSFCFVSDPNGYLLIVSNRSFTWLGSYTGLGPVSSWPWYPRRASGRSENPGGGRGILVTQGESFAYIPAKICGGDCPLSPVPTAQAPAELVKCRVSDIRKDFSHHHPKFILGFRNPCTFWWAGYPLKVEEVHLHFI